MRRNRLSYYIKEGISSIFTHGFMSFASICIIVACLIIMGSFTLLAMNVSRMISSLEDENEVMAFVDENLSEDEARTLQFEIEALDNVSGAVFVTREEAMESYTAQYDEYLFEGFDSSVFRHRYVVYMEDIALMSETKQALEDIGGIAKVRAELEISQGFVTVRNIVSIISVIMVSILLVVSVFIMNNTIKLATFDRREEIAIMKMVGATNDFIRWPFVIQGLILGMVASMIAFLIQWGIYMSVTKNIVGYDTLSMVSAIPFSEMAAQIFLIFLGTGFAVGIGGSLMAIKNYLRV